VNLTATQILVSPGVGRSFWMENATLTITNGHIVGINRIDQQKKVFDTRAEGIVFLVPGFVDMHCHGGGGGSFPSGQADQARTAAAFHAHHGSTSVIASLVTAPHHELLEACVTLAPLVSEGVLAGIHLEGPYLSSLRCGAQDPRWLRDPNLQEINELFHAAQGTIRQVTIAPELPGAMHAIKHITQLGAVAAIGHTNADARTVEAAIDAGARIATHLCNAMPPFHHREETATLSLLTKETIVCELIADGLHLSKAMFQLLTRTAGPGRWALITDAISAAGQPDGQYYLGSVPVTLQHGEARLTASPQHPGGEAVEGPLAGSVLTLDQAVRNAIAWSPQSGLPVGKGPAGGTRSEAEMGPVGFKHGGPQSGFDLIMAFEASSTVAAEALGLGHGAGRLAIGSPADIVGLSADYEVVAVWKRGTRIR
jgi:N-acetylglucosamine-6-phosphate deacetylase